MDQSMKNKSWSGRAFGSGIANRWDVPIGRVVDQYANAYLKNGFNSFSEIENLGQKPSHDILIKVTDINYYMSSQAAHCDLAFSIENSVGRQIFDKKYHEDGPSGGEGSQWGVSSPRNQRYARAPMLCWRISLRNC